MVLSLTQTQDWQVRKLLPKCCNRKNGNCSLLDDGEAHRCYQQEVLYAIVMVKKKRFLNNDYDLFDGLHEPIITQADWDKVKEVQQSKDHPSNHVV